MALITCVECGNEFSDKAPACPKCGCPTSESTKQTETPPEASAEPKKETAAEQAARIASYRKNATATGKPSKAASEAARINSYRKNPSAGADGTKKNGCLVCCLSLFVLVVIFGAIGSMVEDTTPSPSPSQKSTPKMDNSWVPSGFTRYNNKLAIRWSPDGSYTCSYDQRCIQMEVVPRRGCGNLYAELNKIDANGNNVGYTNETTTNVGAGQKAILKFDTYGTFKTFQVSKISCY